MKKNKILCHYMPLPKDSTSKKPKTQGSSQLIVTCDVTSLFEAMYEDNKRLVKENAVLLERAKHRFNNENFIDLKPNNKEEN